MAGLNKFITQARQFWNGLTAKQRVLLGGGAAFTIAVLLIFIRLLADPEYKPLFSGLEPSDAQMLATQLTSKNIPNKVSDDGKSISVPADRIDAARLEVASQGMPRSGRMGFELFDKLSWGQTEFDEKVNYQRALEGELERTIQTLKDVESARVHLVLPVDSVFIDRQRAAKASVILKLRRGSLSAETQMAIARMVAGAVTELSPENVSVIDADTNSPLNPLRRDSVAGNMEEQLTERLMHTLEPVVGSQRVRASVNVEYDPSTMEENQEKYDPASTVALTMQRSEERIANGTLGGVPGTSTNVPGAKAAAATTSTSEDSGQSSKSESSTYAVNRIVRRTLQPAGRIRRITAALLVDDALEVQQQNGKEVEVRRKRTPEELKQLQELASAAIGIDVSRGDVISIENLRFESVKSEAAPLPTRIEQVRKTLNGWSSAIRYVALLILFLLAYLLMLRPIKKHAVNAFKQLPGATPSNSPGEGEDGFELPGFASIGALSGTAQRSASLKKQLVEKIKAEPATSGRLVEAWLRED